MVRMTTCTRLIVRGGWAEDLALRRCTFPIGPRNTWSNSAYVLVGWAAFALVPDVPRLAFALAMTVLGVGSALYHGYKTVAANNADWTGMYAVLAVLVLNATVAVDGGFMLGVISTTSVLAWLLAWHLRHLDVLVGGVTVVVAALTFVFGSQLLAALGVGLIAAGLACWHLDKRGKLGLWGHALWHIFTAWGFGVLALAGNPV